MESFRILFVGDVVPFQTTIARRDAFQALGFPIETVNQHDFLGSLGTWGTRLAFWTLMTPPVTALNREILRRAAEFSPDVVWIEKGVYVFPSTMRALREKTRALMVYHNTDDHSGKDLLHGLHWRYLLRSLPLYDVHVTSNLHNIEEFRRAGYPIVHHMELAASPALKVPDSISEDDRRRLGAPVGFIGHWETATERLLLHLARSGIELKIYGHNWDRAPGRTELGPACQQRTVWGDEYVRAVLSFDINLGIVSKMNRNHTATRTFQVPALGGFLLHERNELVTRYYQEGKEAEFFASQDELLEKCRHYLAHPQERRRIAEAGRRRCMESGYYETDRVREVVAVVRKALAERR